jgi:hypothetical protein
VIRYEPYVECKEDEELLVLLPHTVVHPRTVVVHLLNTPDIYKRKQLAEVKWYTQYLMFGRQQR